MKKKIFAALLAATLVLSMVACGSNDSSETNNNATAKGDSSEQDQEPVDDGIIDFESDSFKVTYTRHETGTDYEGNPCLYYYFNFTNNGDEATNAMTATYIQCFQNGVECETAYVDYNTEMDNYSKNIQSGVTIEVCECFSLTDSSEITLEASDWLSFSDDKDTQTIVLQ